MRAFLFLVAKAIYVLLLESFNLWVLLLNQPKFMPKVAIITYSASHAEEAVHGKCSVADKFKR